MISRREFGKSGNGWLKSPENERYASDEGKSGSGLLKESPKDRWVRAGGNA